MDKPSFRLHGFQWSNYHSKKPSGALVYRGSCRSSSLYTKTNCSSSSTYSSSRWSRGNKCEFHTAGLLSLSNDLFSVLRMQTFWIIRPQSLSLMARYYTCTNPSQRSQWALKWSLRRSDRPLLGLWPRPKCSARVCTSRFPSFPTHRHL